VQLSLVVAMSRDGLIGRAAGLPWKLPHDLRHFRRLTWGRPIIMGRKTHESLGRPLPGRVNIVLSSQSGFSAEGCLVAHDADEAMALAAATGSSEAMVIGGRAVYGTFLPRCGTIYLTLVEGRFEGEVYFPIDLLQSGEWRASATEDWPADERNPHQARYIVLQRRDAGAG
jgi:dihydrofolate reductase